MLRRLPWEDRVYPVLLVGLALAAYLSFASPCVLGGDAGEFAALAARGGVAHPPGYPLLTLVLHAFSRTASSSPVLGAARVTAVIGALAAGALYVACRSWGCSPEASLLAATLYASSPLAWIYATQPEVFTLNALLCASLIALAGTHGPFRAAWRLWAVALVVGLGLSHHQTVLALAPIALLGIVRALRQCDSGTARVRAALVAVGALALGLSPYAYLVWVSRHPEGRWVWGGPMSLSDLVRHFARAEYWSEKAADPRGGAPVMHWAALARSLERGLLVVGVPLAVLGFASALVPGHPRGQDRWGAAALGASLLLAGPVLLALLVAKPVGIFAVVIARFYLLPLLLASIAFAWGADAALSIVPRNAGRAVAWMAATAIVALEAAQVPDEVREADRPTVEQYLRNTLAELPTRAVMVGTGDHRCFGFFYLQTVLAVRTDVVYVEAGMLRDGWYRDRIGRALGEPGMEVGDVAPVLIKALVKRGRAVFVTDSVDTLVAPRLATYALGTVVRVLAPGETPPEPDTLERMNLEIARAFVREATTPRDPWGWSGEVDATYTRPWLELSRAFAAQGKQDRARVDLDRAVARGHDRDE
jgi:Protein of unknown function (DUF2723)